MASNENYTSDKELTEIYNLLDKESLVKLLIEKHRESEKQVKNLSLSSVMKSALPYIPSESTYNLARQMYKDKKRLKALKMVYEDTTMSLREAKNFCSKHFS